LAIAASGVAVVAPAATGSFGFQRVETAFVEADGSPALQAGSHPSAWITRLRLNTLPGAGGGEVPDQALKDLRIELPQGLVGTPTLLPHCSRADLLAETCPPGAKVGTVALETSNEETAGAVFTVYNLVPQPGSAAELGFLAARLPVTIEIGIDLDPPYNLVASLTNVSQFALFYGAELTIAGAPGGTPFLTLPRRCDGPLVTGFEADSWQQPGAWLEAAATAVDGSEPPQPLTLRGCAGLGFAPRLDASPTTGAGQSPSGLDLSFDLDSKGFTQAGSPPTSEVRELSLALPAGMSVNPAAAAGLAACGAAELARETPTSAPGEGCPESSKIGVARVQTPLFEGGLDGSIFVARPDDRATPQPGTENPFDSLLALYAVVKEPARGVAIKLPVRVEADPVSGRLTAILRDLPQIPISHLELSLRGGPRSPLQTPPACGSYPIAYRASPWSGGASVEGSSSFPIDTGCAAGFDPRLSAGTVDPAAGASSDLVVELDRRDGEQALSDLAVHLPPGVSANLGEVPLCPPAAAEEGSCPGASRVGSVAVAVGAGGSPLWLPAGGGPRGAVFLAGPYRGAPFSLVIVQSAQAGPFDLGKVVLRAGIQVAPDDARATLAMDPLPQILDGVPISYRTVHIELDRPGFVRNPTSCRPMKLRLKAVSTEGSVARPTSLFQAAGCGRLGYAPELGLRLIGPTHRGAHPGLRASLRARSGDANTKRLSVTLPETELLDSRHIRAVCSRERFAAGACPRSSVYGHAKAWSPLLGRALHGPIYLRESDHKLPDLVASMRGAVELDLAVRIDAARGRLRFSVERAPDLPFRKIVLAMEGGGKGLLANTSGLCAGRQHAAARLVAHNAREARVRTLVRTDCEGGGRP
jgi:hypothetical protein